MVTENWIPPLPSRATTLNSPTSMCPSNVIDWLERASKLAGTAPIRVALMLLRQANELGRTECLLVTKKRTDRLGLSRASLYNGLEELQAYGLLDINRRRGQPPLVDLLIE